MGREQRYHFHVHSLLRRHWDGHQEEGEGEEEKEEEEENEVGVKADLSNFRRFNADTGL